MHKVKRIRIIVILFAVIAFMAAYIFMFCSVNAAFPQNKRVIYSFGETFTAQGAEFKITNAVLLSKSEIEKDKELTGILERNSGFSSVPDLNLALIDITAVNPGQEELDIDLTSFHLESGAFSLQFYYPLVLYFNDGGMYISLSKYEEKKLKMPVPVAGVHFLDYNYKKVKNRDYFLVYSLYPEKKMAAIKFS